MVKKESTNVQMKSFDELFGESEDSGIDKVIQASSEHRSNKDGEIVRLKLSVVRNFKDHPFKVKNDEDMDKLVTSIKQYGVLHPGIARRSKNNDGTYEAIAGHRRKFASALAGKDDMPFILKDLTDDEAIVIMVDSNIQREDISIKEKAFAYKMKYDALKRMKSEFRRGISDIGRAGRSDEQMEGPDSRNTIQRYIRLTLLTEQLLDWVDEERIPMNAGYTLSFMSEADQILLEKFIRETNIMPSIGQAKELKAYSERGEINTAVIELLMEKKQSEPKIILKDKVLKQYFPPTYTRDDMQDIIITLLSEWQAKNKHKTEENINIPGQVGIEQLEDGKYMPDKLAGGKS